MRVKCIFFQKYAPECPPRPIIFYSANLFFSLITVESPTFCSFAILLRDFSIYLNSNRTLWYLMQ